MGNIVNRLRQQTYSSHPYLLPQDHYPLKADSDSDVKKFTERRKQLIKKVGFDKKVISVAKVSQIGDVSAVRLTIRVGSYNSYIPWEQFRCETCNAMCHKVVRLMPYAEGDYVDSKGEWTNDMTPYVRFIPIIEHEERCTEKINKYAKSLLFQRQCDHMQRYEAYDLKSARENSRCGVYMIKLKGTIHDQFNGYTGNEVNVCMRDMLTLKDITHDTHRNHMESVHNLKTNGTGAVIIE